MVYDNFMKKKDRLITNLIKLTFDITILKNKFINFCFSGINRWAKFGRDITGMMDVYYRQLFT